MKTYDLIILGAGPGGLTAAIYAARYKLDALVIGKLFGGTASEAHKICNFPSYYEISGFKLMSEILSHAKKLGVDIRQEEIKEIKKEKEFQIRTDKKEYAAKRIIIATGSEKIKLGLENEEKFLGKGISYCATCDAGFYNNKIVGVVGGGNAALTAALLLEKFAKKVYLIYRREKFSKAEPAWVEEVKTKKKIDVMFSSTVSKLIGCNKLEEVEVLKGDEQKKIKTDGLFVEVGSDPNSKLAEGIGVKLNENKEIIVDKKQETNINGIFAVGDVTNNMLKQIVTSCGEGAVAAYSVYEELVKENN